MPLSLSFATGNPGKVAEATKILADFQVKHFDTDLVEIRSEDLEEIAKTSLESLLEGGVDRRVFVEDSGIFIDALDGFPGPISGYVYDKLGNRRILSLMASEADNRDAVFKSVVALQIPEGDIITFLGRAEGAITREARGTSGFDYDSIFQPTGSDKTFAEMDRSEKNQHSHRGKALRNMRTYLQGQADT